MLKVQFYSTEKIPEKSSLTRVHPGIPRLRIRLRKGPREGGGLRSHNPIDPQGN